MKSRFPLYEIANAPLILDASALINLLGTGIAGRLLQVLGLPATMEERAFAEVRRHPIPETDLATEIEGLVRSGLLVTARMPESATGLFMELTGAGLERGLDDGEAATIAYAIVTSDDAVIVLDERKATKIVNARWIDRQVIDTVTLLAQPSLRNKLDGDALAEACFSALLHARMRVPQNAMHWVVDTIGHARARRCPSLGSWTVLTQNLAKQDDVPSTARSRTPT